MFNKLVKIIKSNSSLSSYMSFEKWIERLVKSKIISFTSELHYGLVVNTYSLNNGLSIQLTMDANDIVDVIIYSSIKRKIIAFN